METNKRAALEKFAKAVRNRYIEGLSEVKTTGKSEKSISYVVNDDSVVMLAGAWFPAIDFGRARSRATSSTGFFNELKKWIIKKDSFRLTTKVNLNNATRSLQYKINRYGTKGNVFSKDRKILSSINIDDLTKNLVNEIGRESIDKITNAIVYDTRFQFIEVKLKK